MKKWLPYMLGGLVLLLFIIAIMASKGKPTRRMDERITLRQRDKIPYGTAVAKHLLPSLFPNASIYVDARYPGAWDKINAFESNQAVILVADYFNAEDDELKRLENFIEKGNFVFIIARSFSDDASRFLNLNVSGYYNLYAGENEDTLSARLVKPSFTINTLYTFPGKNYEGRVQGLDSGKTLLLGENGTGTPNFVQLNKGAGSLFLHTSPLTFSNYFILHKQNVIYYQQAFSVIPKDVKAVLWNEYFLEKLHSPSSKEDVNWLGTLFKYPAFKWGLLTALFTLLLYVLLGMRRKQRVIPPYEKPKNDSLDFVKTLGRLYYDRGDHKNLAEKMGTYFLEHVRSTYKLATHALDEEFVRSLHIKSGYPEPEIQRIILEINRLSDWPHISEERLAAFHGQLELFYQNT